ncbi:MAG: hypothetical protein ACFE9P_01730 [Candidatus Hermodarchaeota archaeon]
MRKISKIIPEWKELIDLGLKYNKAETLRTLRHIFRSLWIYYAIMNEKLNLEIKRENITLLKNNLVKIFNYNRDIFPLLLLFHDIGRPFNREWHTFESANLIKQKKMLSKLGLNFKQQKVLYGTIKYHLLLGTIFTGESSYYGAISIFNDQDLQELWSFQEDIYTFFQILTTFTIIDILGYDYSRIFDHYFDNYENIHQNLTSIFIKTRTFAFDNRRFALFKALSDLDIQNLKWRISCALRIFQFVDTNSELTKELYYSKIEGALRETGNSWENFIKSLQDEHTVIQFKYALPLLMVLASTSFKREPIKYDDQVDPRLFLFWQNCCEKVRYYQRKNQRKEKKIPKLWNFIFELPRGWFYKKEYIDFLRSEKLFDYLKKITPIYSSEFDNYFVNFSLII